MKRLPKVLPVTEFRSDAAAALKAVSTSKTPVIITQRGRAAAVMLSLQAYEQAEQEREILLQLARGEKEIAAGKGYGLDEVMADIDALLDGDKA